MHRVSPAAAVALLLLVAAAAAAAAAAARAEVAGVSGAPGALTSPRKDEGAAALARLAKGRVRGGAVLVGVAYTVVGGVRHDGRALPPASCRGEDASVAAALAAFAVAAEASAPGAWMLALAIDGSREADQGEKEVQLLTCARRAIAAALGEGGNRHDNDTATVAGDSLLVPMTPEGLSRQAAVANARMGGDIPAAIASAEVAELRKLASFLSIGAVLAEALEVKGHSAVIWQVDGTDSAVRSDAVAAVPVATGAPQRLPNRSAVAALAVAARCAGGGAMALEEMRALTHLRALEREQQPTGPRRHRRKAGGGSSTGVGESVSLFDPPLFPVWAYRRPLVSLNALGLNEGRIQTDGGCPPPLSSVRWSSRYTMGGGTALGLRGNVGPTDGLIGVHQLCDVLPWPLCELAGQLEHGARSEHSSESSDVEGVAAARIKDAAVLPPALGSLSAALERAAEALFRASATSALARGANVTGDGSLAMCRQLLEATAPAGITIADPTASRGAEIVRPAGQWLAHCLANVELLAPAHPTGRMAATMPQRDTPLSAWVNRLGLVATV